MPGIGELALGAAPIAGGALLGVLAGNVKPPDLRGIIKQDMDLLDRLPDGDVERRAGLQRVIDGRVDELVAGYDKNQSLRQMARSYSGNWRDLVVFVCAVLFTIVWWDVDHQKHSNWVLMFTVLIILCIITAVYAGRGVLRAVRTLLRSARHPDERGPQPKTQ
jgi:hypothetical protein